ncbi:MAG TPA: hypothetical protein VJ824_16000 [Bacillota bacterium]|nr:hypothetical protein [Bacillota bacterium]
MKRIGLWTTTFVVLFSILGCQTSPSMVSYQADDSPNPIVNQEKETIKKEIHKMNKEPYRIVDITYPSIRVMNLDSGLSQIRADVVMEKNGHYDWMRVEYELEKDHILSQHRIPIDYYEDIHPTHTLPDQAKDALVAAMASLKTEDRSWFGIDKQDHQLLSKGIEDIQVEKVEPMGESEDKQRVLSRVTVEVKSYQHVNKGEYLIFLRNYESKKWQIEDIQRIGSPQE